MGQQDSREGGIFLSAAVHAAIGQLSQLNFGHSLWVSLHTMGMRP